MWREAIGHVVGIWTNEEYEFSGEFWQMPKRRVHPKPMQKPHPPIWGATSSEDGHREVGKLGLGLCSFAVGVSPDEVKQKVDIYREALEGCTEPIGAFMNDDAATFTMTLCSRDRQQALDLARESFEWYPAKGARLIASLTDWMAEKKQDLGNYAYAADMKAIDDQGMLDLLTLEYLVDSNACVLGTPEGMRRDLPSLRRGRNRHPALPRESLQDTSRGCHGDDRAHGHKRSSRNSPTEIASPFYQRQPSMNDSTFLSTCRARPACWATRRL